MWHLRVGFLVPERKIMEGLRCGFFLSIMPQQKSWRAKQMLRENKGVSCGDSDAPARSGESIQAQRNKNAHKKRAVWWFHGLVEWTK
jgi:hypothetical protein